MGNRLRVLTRVLFALAVFALMVAGCSKAPSPSRKVKGVMQARPGGPMEEVEVAVHEVPVDVPSVAAVQASLEDDELVLGVVVDGQALAYPIRYLALYEVVNNRVGDTPLAPTW